MFSETKQTLIFPTSTPFLKNIKTCSSNVHETHFVLVIMLDR